MSTDMLKRWVNSISDTKGMYRAVITTVILVIVILVGFIPFLSYANDFDIPKTNMNLKGERIKSEDYIRLEWNTPDQEEPYTYQVYSKKPKSDDYQTISTTDLNRKVKVLNVYPNLAGATETWTSWDGTTYNLQQSARLFGWMESPNSYDPKGFGKGLIDVTPLNLETFKTDPNKHLKDESGNYIYDVVYFGSWDAVKGQDISVEGAGAIREFYNTGRGVLFGHDQIYYGNPNFVTLSDLVLIEHNEGSASDTEVRVSKTGLLTTYPWQLDPTDDYTIPYTHTTSLSTGADVWFEFKTGTGGTLGNAPFKREDGRTNNFYLATYNNAAMIQTGHSRGEATPDEQRILANTIFYLSQLTTETGIEDRSSEDVYAPEFNDTNYTVNHGETAVTVNIPTAKEVEEPFEYYVVATGQSTGNTYQSEGVTVTNHTGLKGYSYTMDNNKDTIPDNTVDTTSTTITVPNKQQKQYLHVSAVDNAGNISETLHITLDRTKPTVSITQRPEGWTKGNVTLNVNAKDTDSGVLSITLPNGLVVNGSTSDYVVTTNGDYTFKVTDNAGNIQEVPYKVTNIDKSIPRHGKVWVDGVTNDSLYIYIDGVTDSSSGIKEVRFPTWTDKGGQDDLQSGWTTNPIVVGEDMGNGVWRYKVERTEHKGEFGKYITHPYVYDNAGNAKATAIYYEMKDIVPPELTVSTSQTSITRGDVELSVRAVDEHTGVKTLTLPDGTEVNTNVGKGVETSHIYKVTKNGEYTFKAEDEYGTESIKTFTVSNIDKTVPTVKVTGNPTEWVGDDVITLNINAQDNLSGVKSITLPDGKEVNAESTSFEVRENGEYEFKVTDNVGNVTTHKVKVEFMMLPYTFYLYDSKGNPLQGAGFDLYRDGVKYADAISDSTGLVDFEKVPPTGKYTIKQTKAPDGYIIDPTEKDVEVGDATEPEEFISYPRGDVLPATGSNYAFKYLSILGITSGVVLWVRSKRKKIQ